MLRVSIPSWLPPRSSATIYRTCSLRKTAIYGLRLMFTDLFSPYIFDTVYKLSLKLPSVLCENGKKSRKMLNYK